MENYVYEANLSVKVGMVRHVDMKGVCIISLVEYGRQH